MMKKGIAGFVMFFCLTCGIGIANASLTTIGTATYLGTGYNLVWDNDNNGNSLVWFDYTRNNQTWSAQNAWADSLESALTIHLIDGYSVKWIDEQWRLPEVGTMQALYSEGMNPFSHLVTGVDPYYAAYPYPINQYTYWTITQHTGSASYAYLFNMGTGAISNRNKAGISQGIAVRGAAVDFSQGAAVPVPGTMFLLGIGLAGVAGRCRNRKV